MHRALGLLLGSASLVFFATACGGSSSGASSPESGSSGDSGSESWGSGEGSESSGPTGPDCSDGTCFACGEGLCPKGAYCDEGATGGAACAWIAECAGEPSCSCLTGVLGSSCSCDDSGDGPLVSCQ